LEYIFLVERYNTLTLRHKEELRNTGFLNTKYKYILTIEVEEGKEKYKILF
jgi:hypothetical protein